VVFFSLYLPLKVSAESGTQTVTDLASLLAMDLESLGSVQVFTASRELTDIEEAPSVVTVITAEEIRQRGHRTLKDVLDRVPGFFNSTDTSLSLIGNRGYTQNPNSNYLMLIDGHSVNNPGSIGLGNNHMLPFLYQIKRIEIIRGPGSTLWGGDAANGIIHLFTYDGKDLAKDGKPFTQMNFDYEFNRQRHVANALFGTTLGDEGDLMISLTQTRSGAGFQDVRKDSASGLVADTGFQYKYEAWNPSYELQAKANWRDFRLNARSFRHQSFLGEVRPRRSQSDRDYNYNFIELSYSPQLTDNLSLKADIYRNWVNLDFRGKNVDGTLSDGSDSSHTENGVNAILTYQGLTDHRLKAGVQWQRRDFNGKINKSPPNAPFFVTPVGIENATGIFIEDEYSGIEDWRFTLGMRYQRNDFRQAGSDLLWRGAAIWLFDDRWTFKYMFNSGVVRATLTRSRGTLQNPLVIGNAAEVGPKNPQLAFSHDLQALYSDGKTRASITLFKQDVNQFIARIQPFLTGTSLPDGTPIRVREANLGNLEAYGLELEGEHQLNDNWLLYGNYAWAVNNVNKTTGPVPGLPGATFDLVEGGTFFTNGGRTTGVPEHIWNLGFDWSFAPKLHINVHYRGWSGNWGKVATSPARFDSYGPEHYIDLNLRCRYCYTKRVEMQAYIKNLLNNRSPLPSAAHGGDIRGFGREVGVSIAYRF